MRPWTERYPGRLEAEVEAFAEAEGLDLQLDTAELASTGRIVFEGTLTLPGRKPIRLQVRYPDSFPHLRPEVFALNLSLERHQNPYRHNLCLLEGSTRQWDPALTGAWLVRERIPELLSLVEGDPEEMRRREAPQCEPASAYFVSAVGGVVFIPDAMLHLPKDQRGGVARLSAGSAEPRAPLIRACLTSVAVKGRKGRIQPLAQADNALRQRFNKTEYEVRWLRLDAFPTQGHGTGPELWAVAQASPAFVEPPVQAVDGTRLRILGVVCEEEVRQGKYEDAWVFVVNVTEPHAPRREQLYLIRGERLSPQDLGERIPTLHGLSEKTVALTGLGALGGPVACELVRSQLGELRILDGDRVETGTIVRWPRGTTAVGHRKTQVLADWLPVEYPFTVVQQFPHHLGYVPAAGEVVEDGETQVLAELLADADMLVDATAEIGVQQLLASLAGDLGLPQVYVWATEGGWGGVVARVIPAQTGCWLCLQHHLADGSIVAPPAAPTGTIQPRGCVAPTWTGSSFDGLPVIAQAVRTACFTLLGARTEDAADVFVCDQKAESPNQLVAPRWTSYPLNVHPACAICASS